MEEEHGGVGRGHGDDKVDVEGGADGEVRLREGSVEMTRDRPGDHPPREDSENRDHEAEEEADDGDEVIDPRRCHGIEQSSAKEWQKQKRFVLREKGANLNI